MCLVALAGRGSRPLPRSAAVPHARAEAAAAPPRAAPPRVPEGTGPLQAPPSDDAPRDAHVPGLLRLLDTDEPRKDKLVREIAALGGAAAWEGLIERLRDPSLRTAIEVALGERAPPEFIDRLKGELLASADPAARASGARILANTADARHGADVRELLLGEREWEVRHAAIGALGRFGDATTLVGLARHGGREGRTAGFALMECRDTGALEEAATRWPELDPGTRFALLHAATGAGGPFLDVAKEALHDPDERVRLQSVRVLGGLGDDAVEPLLDHALRDLGATEAERAVQVLADLGTRRAAEAGLRALETLPPRRQEPYRAAFLLTLGR